MSSLNNNGVALIMVLWVVVLLSVLVLEFSYAMRVEGTATRNFKEEMDCYFYAQSGFQQAVAELTRNFSVRQNEFEEEDLERLKTWRDDQRKITLRFERGRAEVAISNERGKYDLNTIPDDLLRNLIGGLGVGEVERDIITDSILDWRDQDNFHLLNGAEDEYYEALPKPYSCKDGNFDTVEELLQVRGVTPELFYGCSGGGSDAAPGWQKGLVDLVTVYSRTTRIDVNSAPKEVLLTLPGLSGESADGIIKAREEKPLKDINELRQLMGEDLFALAFKHVAIAPSMIFSIVSTGRVPKSGTQRRIKAIVRITPRAKEKYQVIYWADDYPIAENLVSLGPNPWEMPGEEFS